MRLKYNYEFSLINSERNYSEVNQAKLENEKHNKKR